MRCTLLLLALLQVSIAALAQLTYQNLIVDYNGAKTHRFLQIIPIRAKAAFMDGSVNPSADYLNNALSLQQAMEMNVVEVEDRLGVNQLEVSNNSAQPVFIMSGEILEGGRQDRAFARDVVIPPYANNVRVPVFCVEQDRWGNRKKFKYYHEASMHLRQKIDRDRNQGSVWKEIDEENRADGVRSATRAYTAHGNNNNYVRLENEYLEQFPRTAFANPENIIGIVAVTGDWVIGCDIFITPQLFEREYNTLIFSYIDEAISFGQPISIQQQQIRNYCDQLLSNEISQKRFIDRNGKAFEEEGRVIHITTYENR
ncbi:MAG: hypothetical protein MUF24_12320 [Chitinophagaceae bacterium]|jgi:hypothetical protein|nr:hypothetical protein [Chitinophagaceae bacterium]